METTRDTVPAHPEGPPVVLMPAIPGYEVLALVGRGGMGKVYRARHIALGRIVAIKILAHEPDEKSLARFREEARAVARLQHPNIAQLFETGIADGQPYYAQEFVEGGSLARALRRPAAGPARRGPAGRSRGPGHSAQPRERHPAPRPEARQHPRHRRRHAEGDRLRPGQEHRAPAAPTPRWTAAEA